MLRCAHTHLCTVTRGGSKMLSAAACTCSSMLSAAACTCTTEAGGTAGHSFETCRCGPMPPIAPCILQEVPDQRDCPAIVIGQIPQIHKFRTDPLVIHVRRGLHQPLYMMYNNHAASPIPRRSLHAFYARRGWVGVEPG